MVADRPSPDPLERVFLSSSPEVTEELAERIGRLLPGGSVVALVGDLGSGKTCFVRGLARGLEISDGVASPTFTLMQEHEGRLPLYHFDAWMEGRHKSLFLDGGDEWLRAGGVAAVEWADRVLEWMPPDRLDVGMEHAGETERRIRIAARGSGGEGAGGTGLRELLRSLRLPAGLIEEDRGAGR